MFWLFLGLLILSLAALPVLGLIARRRSEGLNALIPEPSARKESGTEEASVNTQSAGDELLLVRIRPELELMVQKEVQRRVVGAFGRLAGEMGAGIFTSPSLGRSEPKSERVEIPGRTSGEGYILTPWPSAFGVFREERR